MENKMLIDAAHPEETRVVVVRGNRVEEFDFEAENKKQLKGNIYLAKVTRVEPSLQAAFVDYGGNRHGFLAFSEIHPDYYQIPVADRQALLEEEAAAHKAANSEEDEEEAPKKRGSRRRPSTRSAKAKTDDTVQSDIVEDVATDSVTGTDGTEESVKPDDIKTETSAEATENETDPAQVADAENAADETTTDDVNTPSETTDKTDSTDQVTKSAKQSTARKTGTKTSTKISEDDEDEGDDEDDSVESVGSEDAMEEVPVRHSRQRAKQYKIQEVIKRRQIILVQVVKEERGNKGAALTTYLSLAGRYSVLMPNTDRGGGISRKITNQTDRKRLRVIASDLDVAEGMGIILRTAGASRTKTEIKRDFEYLMRLWENVRDFTLKSSAPKLVYEEGNLLKRSIRDLYNKDIKQVVVSGDEGYREAKDFMRMLMPSHAKNVQPYKEHQPLFTRYGVEPQLDAMFSPQVTLKSGGYLVINQTEALVSIDVNSGRSTRENSIEDTALSTNLETAEEVARQLRLRDLAGLIVIDFIDMEENRNNRAVERRLKECLRDDRARIQVGRISHFGLLEMSRQRIRAGVLESTMELCPHCEGTGFIRGPASIALHVLRAIEDHLLKGSKHHVIVKTKTTVALYILNQKRDHLTELEGRFGLTVTLDADETITGDYCSILHGERAEAPKTPTMVTPDTVDIDAELDAEAEAAERDLAAAEREQENSEEENTRKRRRPRSRRRNREDENTVETIEADSAKEDEGETPNIEALSGDDSEEEQKKKRRRRGRRGGRRKREHKDELPETTLETTSEETSESTADKTSDEETAEVVSIEPYSIESTTPSQDNDLTEKNEEAKESTPEVIEEVVISTEKAIDNKPPSVDADIKKDTTQAKPGKSGWWQRRSFF